MDAPLSITPSPVPLLIFQVPAGEWRCGRQSGSGRPEIWPAPHDWRIATDGDRELGGGTGSTVAEPLGRFERATAVAVGVAAGGGGGYAVFASSNQAGTAILLILSAIFLLIGIQGTSLVRFNTGTNTVELERRKRVERALKEATQEPDLERAEGIVEGIAIAQPSQPYLPEAKAELYRRRLHAAIIELGYQVADVHRSIQMPI